MKFWPSFSTIFITIYIRLSYAHTWIERVHVLDRGIPIGEPGFPRGNGNI